MKTRFLCTLVLLAGGVHSASGEGTAGASGPPEIVLSDAGRFSSANAGDTPARSVAGPSIQAPPANVFGGGSFTFEVSVDAPLGTRLKIVGDLVQVVSGGLAAPLRKNALMCPELVFDRCTHQVAACTLPGLADVQRLTRTLLTLRTDPAGASLTVPVYLYPRAAPDGWRKTVAAQLARSGLRRLAVFGDGPAIRRFLHERQVPFEDLGQDWPARTDPRTLYLGETPIPAPPRLDDAPGLRMVVFSTRTDSGLLPGFYQSAVANGASVWKVTLSGLLDGLSDDPRAQQTLAEIFRLALPPGSTTAPTDHDP